MKFYLLIIILFLIGCQNSSIFFEKIETQHYTTKAIEYNYVEDKTEYERIKIEASESKYSTYNTDYNQKLEHDIGPKIYLKVR